MACFALNFLAHGKISDLSVYGTAYGCVYEKLTDERSQRKGDREEREKEGKERREGEKGNQREWTCKSENAADICGSEKHIGATTRGFSTMM